MVGAPGIEPGTSCSQRSGSSSRPRLIRQGVGGVVVGHGHAPSPGIYPRELATADLSLSSGPKCVPLSLTADTLSYAVDSYLHACVAEGKAPKTVTAYGETLTQFLAICREQGLPNSAKAFTAQGVYAYLHAVAGRGVSFATRHRRYRETRAFFAWCERMGSIEVNPFAGVPNVRLESKIVRPFSVDEVHRLLAVCSGDNEFDVRNRAIILLLLDTGIRSGELRLLNIEDLDRNACRLHVRHGKGRRQRVVPFTQLPDLALEGYIDGFRGDSPGALFKTVATRHGSRRLNPYHLINLIKKLGARADVHAHPHRFRHTFATWAIEAGAREIDVQYLLGHSSSVMVRRYSATYDAEKAALNHRPFSPVANIT